MAWKTGDRIYETSTTTGTGTYTLDGAVTGFQAFSTLGAANLCPYFATDDINWEVGIGTIATGPNTLARTVILASSNAGSAVNWAAGTRKIRCGLPASFAAGRAAVEARSSNTILSHGDHGKVIKATSTFSQTFTAAATLGDGWWCAIRNDGTGVITLDPNGSETINGSTTIALNPGEALTVFCDGSNFKAYGTLHSVLRNSLAADVNLNSIGTYFTGPVVSQGTVGTWLAIGSVVCDDTAGASTIHAKLWDGTSVIDEGTGDLYTAGARVTITLVGIIANPAADVKISCADAGSTSGHIKYNTVGNSKGSTLTLIRIG